MAKKTEQENKLAAFDKVAILNSKRFRESKDLLNVILDEKKQYTLDEVEVLLKKELEREVTKC